jgi:YgiT-type zinc finger domain-containing protein
MQRKYSSCSYCGGSVLERHVVVETWFGEKLVLFEDVPAGVCENCGEEYFSADIQKQMMNIIQKPPKKTITVPLYRFADALSVAKSNAQRKKDKDSSAFELDDEVHIATDDELDDLLQTDLDDWDE